MEIYLLRHGHTPQPGTYTGSTDVELSIEGTRHVSNLSPLFDQLDFDCCFCSPLSRCRQTVSLLAIDAELIFDDCLREIDFGDWEGLSFADVQANYPEQLDKWAREGEDFTFPGGETIRTFNARISGWFDKLLTNKFNRVLIVAHGGVIRAGISHLLGIDQPRAFVFNPKEAGVSKIRVIDGYGNLEFFNCSG
ncbi:MAG: histidine phosphatase family protein [Desulfofustis sp.]